jgi:dTDP-4-dehydrorhamnose reductase
MRILLLGSDGQVGWELQRALAPLGEVFAASRTPGAPLRGDLEQPEAVRELVRSIHPDVIVNAAAYTAVDAAETDVARARLTNATTPALLASEAARLGAWLVHYSTDYVFDGTGTRPWKEDDPTSPCNAYGRSKLEGEELIRASGCQHLTFRTSWVYASRGKNFLRTMLRLSAEHDKLSVVDDQHGAPTGAELIADATVHALQAARANPALAGTYHLVAAGETTWYHYARHAIGTARALGHPVKVGDEAITPCRTADFRAPAARPQNSRLSTARLQEAFGLHMPAWQQGVERAVRELCNK